jgi:hypothetical protein
MKMIRLALVILVFVGVMGEIPHLNKKQITEKIDSTKINYGSTIRIRASAFPY